MTDGPELQSDGGDQPPEYAGEHGQTGGEPVVTEPVSEGSAEAAAPTGIKMRTTRLNTAWWERDSVLTLSVCATGTPRVGWTTSSTKRQTYFMRSTTQRSPRATLRFGWATPRVSAR